MMAAQITKAKGAYVIASTQSEQKRAALLENGADEVMIDQGNLQEKVQEKHPQGVDKILELIDTKPY